MEKDFPWQLLSALPIVTAPGSSTVAVAVAPEAICVMGALVTNPSAHSSALPGTRATEVTFTGYAFGFLTLTAALPVAPGYSRPVVTAPTDEFLEADHTAVRLRMGFSWGGARWVRHQVRGTLNHYTACTSQENGDPAGTVVIRHGSVTRIRELEVRGLMTRKGPRFRKNLGPHHV
ncbi:hypothetical protein SAMN05421507_1011561 [Lentzea jiangxiensis]|uniref:Uncharacterized protein n=1 Tax=Lentzea jiangxiensis TaxID=641025 RepID=A0A1H0H868_9PSEU|nr:hypothetical protein SAMN05421507_1011561 [Lentzea jiangxiensis]